MANPSYFANSHSFVINSSNFATVQGNQIVNYFNREPERRKALTIYDQFRQVIQGDIHRTKDLGVYEYPREWDDGHRFSWEKGKPRADRTICAAQVIGGEGREFTVIAYTGPEAREAFEQDFRMYSQTLNASPFQVFGVNTHVPTVLFYDERQPVANFWGGLGIFGTCYLETLRMQFGCNGNEIWLDPKKGELYRGPEGPDCIMSASSLVLAMMVLPCSAELLQDDICLRFLASRKSKDVDQWIMVWTAHKLSETKEVSEGKVHQQTFVTLMNTTIAVGGGSWKDHWGSLCEREVFENGVKSFTLNDKGDNLRLYIDSCNEREVWLSQASSIFHQYGISIEDDSSQELIIPDLCLDGRLSTSETTRQRRREKNIYLFAQPLPPSTPSTWCTTSSLHHWSFDTTGQHPLPVETCEDLDLPIELSFKVWSKNRRYRWNNEPYKWMHEYRLARGFDPKTPAFARHLGHPIYQVQTISDRFEEDVTSIMASPTQSSFTVSTSSGLDDRSEDTSPSAPFRSHPPFTGAIYSNDTSWNVNLPPLGLSPISPLALPAAYPLPSFTSPNPLEELWGRDATDTSSLKRKNRDTSNLNTFLEPNAKRARLLETNESDSTSRLWPAQEAKWGGSTEGEDGVLRGAEPYTPNRGMSEPVVRPNELKDENRQLREEIERLKELKENRRLKEELERLKETLRVGTSNSGSNNR